jgi:hypothetical protein
MQQGMEYIAKDINDGTIVRNLVVIYIYIYIKLVRSCNHILIELY